MPQKKVLVAVGGGVAAYKTAMLVSLLAQRGHAIRVVMTRASQRFVGPATFAALSGQPVVTDLFDPSFPLGAHIELARWGDLLCVAPATAKFLAQAAAGHADDLLGTLYLCFRGPVIVAPAMNSEMWDKPAVQRNVKQLRDDGVTIIGPDEGWLSCRVAGPGRMSEPQVLVSAIDNALFDATA